MMTLIPHPLSDSRAASDINARVQWAATVSMTITFVLKGRLDQLRIPSPGLPGRADRLWEHTCFEAFIGVKSDPAYYEFNFSPSGEWAAYAFRAYRDGGTLEAARLKPAIETHRAADSLELNAGIDLSSLSGIQLNSWLRIGLSAVIEEQDGRLSYWALKHPVARPDFHHPAAFALELGAPGEDAASIPAHTSKL